MKAPHEPLAVLEVHDPVLGQRQHKGALRTADRIVRPVEAHLARQRAEAVGVADSERARVEGGVVDDSLDALPRASQAAATTAAAGARRRTTSVFAGFVAAKEPMVARALRVA